MEKGKIKLVNPLLESREEALKNAEISAIRPFGKWKGMDVFTWYKPSVYELSAVLSSFPFPVCWLGTRALIEEFSSIDPTMFKAMNWIGQYDSPQITIPSDLAAPIPLVTATEGLEDTLMFLEQLSVPKHILLFTYQGNEWKTNITNFKEFLSNK